ncbi:DUF4355 domain-containing protein [Lacticaseibacillus saniviri]|uniref:Phage scaffold protein n=1 Tax=Lacticaseibacillus saniviri JCM 17471 = DSM 24301 TaxID=1293598 RepID=A0A0R2MWD1_9LACO|nr:DUF4355 domain-containing protein [Lacticaseibacillus saniviri]KRO15891.1 hypothetical protein IV56_GL002081 [Lacticaseibacillus saniviri JCM 17471 = DSM 24301]
MFNKDFHLVRLFDADTGAAGGPDNSTLETQGQNQSGESHDAATDEGEEHTELKYTDKDVDKIVAAKREKWEKQQAKQKSEAERLAGMSDDDRAAEERKVLEEKAAGLQAELDKRNMRDTARGLFNAAGLEVTDDDLNLVVTTEADSTKANVGQLIELAKRIRKSAEKDFLSGDPIKRGAGKPAKAGSLGAQLAQKQVQSAANQHKFFEH